MENNNENKIIFDININSIEDLYWILLNKWYDFVTLESDENFTSVKFRKWWKIIEEKFIKTSIYTEILTKAKTISGLDVWVTTEEQEWTWEVDFNEKKYNSLAKVVPGKFWEKLFLKLKEKEVKKVNKEVKPIELWKILGFFGAMLIVLLIVSSSFLTFIILNAKTVEDVNFFLSLWINLNEINWFIAKIVNIFFWVLTWIFTIFFIVFLFKGILTKKIFKRKKTLAWILSILFWILTFSTLAWWMAINEKVKSLPKWDILALWDVVIYDNTIYNSEYFEDEKNKSQREVKSALRNTTDLIWPLNLRFDISELARKEQIWWLKITKYIWDFWSAWAEETFTPILPSKIFDEKWNYEVSVEIELTDNLNNITRKTLKNIPRISITDIVKITETEQISWGKIFKLDASELRKLWRIKWYNWDSEIPIIQNIFTSWVVFDETIIRLVVWDENTSTFKERYFIIWWGENWQITGKIKYKKNPTNDREITFYVEEPKTSDWNWMIEEFIWKIQEKEVKLSWETELDSEFKHNFMSYWEYNISVTIKSSSWKTRTLNEIININKDLKIRDWLKFYYWDDKNPINNVRHNSNIWQYNIDNFGTPEIMKIDARYVKSDNENYYLSEVSWDYDSNWEIDRRTKEIEKEILLEWRHRITVNYKFKNLRISDDIIDVKEEIFIEAIKKDVDINFTIKQDSEYVPTIIWFDASKSKIKDANISKFIWNFGDGTSTTWDAIIEGHRYLKDWNYTVTLDVITADWRKFSTSRKLVLKPKAQKVKIKTSLKEAPTYQWIDFDSSESIWDITDYLWDFWDWEISTEANPSHFYTKPGTYKVKLTVDFRDRNMMTDTIEVKIRN